MGNTASLSNCVSAVESAPLEVSHPPNSSHLTELEIPADIDTSHGNVSTADSENSEGNCTPDSRFQIITDEFGGGNSFLLGAESPILAEKEPERSFDRKQINADFAPSDRCSF